MLTASLQPTLQARAAPVGTRNDAMARVLKIAWAIWHPCPLQVLGGGAQDVSDVAESARHKGRVSNVPKIECTVRVLAEQIHRPTAHPQVDLNVGVTGAEVTDRRQHD